MNRLFAARILSTALVCALFACGCQPSESVPSAKPKPKPSTSSANAPGDVGAVDSRLRLGDIDWPELTREMPTDRQKNPRAKAKSQHCQFLEAKEISEFEAPWADAIVALSLSCTQNDTGFRSVATARLREEAATLFDRPVVEIRQEHSDHSISESAVLVGTLTQASQGLIEGLQARCRAHHSGASCRAERTQGEDSGIAYTRDRIDLGGTFYQLSQTADSPQKIVYIASMERF